MIVGALAVCLVVAWKLGYFSPVADPVALAMAPVDAEPGRLGAAGEWTWISSFLQGFLLIVGEVILFGGRWIFKFVGWLFSFVMRTMFGMTEGGKSVLAAWDHFKESMSPQDSLSVSSATDGGFVGKGVTAITGSRSDDATATGAADVTRLDRIEKSIRDLTVVVIKNQALRRQLDGAKTFAEFRQIREAYRSTEGQS
jgi:hypothetical protein